MWDRVDAERSPCARRLIGRIARRVAAFQPDAVSFKDEDITNQPSHIVLAKGIAQVPEGRMIFGNLTIEENLMFVARLYNGIKGDETIGFVNPLTETQFLALWRYYSTD